MSLLSSVVQLSLKIAETGLTIGDALDKLTGTHARPASDAPVFGPANLDQALSDLANRTARIFYFTPPSAEALPTAVEHWLKAVRLQAAPNTPPQRR